MNYETILSQFAEKMIEVLAKPRYHFSDVSSSEIPKDTGVYLIHDKRTKVIINIGRTGNLRRRLLGDHKRGRVTNSQFRRALGQRFNLESEAKSLTTS